MLGRLEAEEALDAVLRMSVGSGAMKREDADGFLRAWAERADPHPADRARAPRATPGHLRAMGIGVERVRRPKP